MNLQGYYRSPILQEEIHQSMAGSHHGWVWKALHFPTPLSPFAGSVFPDIIARSSETAFRLLSFPLCRLEGKIFRSYYYQQPVPSTPPFSHSSAGEGSRRTPVEDISGDTLLNSWKMEWFPQIWSDVQSLREFDLVEGSLPELFAHLERGIAIQTRHWQYYFLLLIPALSILSRYLHCCEALSLTTNPLEALLLLPGSENKHLELHAHLWELAQQARKSPFVLSAFLESPGETILQALKKRKPGRLFIRQLEDMLAAYGHCSSSHDYLDPTWWEDSSLVVNGVRGYLSRPDYTHFHALQQRRRNREDLERKWYGRLSFSPDGREQFQQHLFEARLAYALQEDQAFFIDQICSAEVRRVILECSSRFVAEHKLAGIEDIFFLTLEEVRSLACLHKPPVHIQEKIQERRHYWAESWRYAPLLEPLSAYPVTSTLEQRLIAELLNLIQFPERSSEEGEVVKGICASPGQIQGRVCVVNSFRDFSALEPGNVLVCRAVLPSWSPLFSLASALVTDVGGLLSFGAITARECGIPAVVATRRGTKTLRSGELVYVDGETGEVHREISRSSL